MSRKYQRLTEHLAGLDETSWRATFEDVERVLGFPLPDSARTYQAWWANQSRSQSLSWQRAGWKVTDLDVKNERLTFVYVGGDDDEGIEGRDSNPQSSAGGNGTQGMTIAEAKLRLAETFGVSSDQIEITIKG